MITKFLYEIDESNRKVINAVVENSQATETLTGYPLMEQVTYKKNENDNITLNNGELVYVVFNDNEQKKYLDVSIIKSEVKIKLTDNISFAACISKNMATVILYHYDYFKLEDCQFISSGFYKNPQGLLKDKLDNFFKKANDDCHCQIRKDGIVYFVAKDEKRNYFLTEDFAKATRLSKNDTRKILTIYGFVDKNSEKNDLSFSKFNCFTNGKDYLFAGNKPLRVGFTDSDLIIDDSVTKILLEDRLINNEMVHNKLKNIYFNLDSPLTNKVYYLKYNKHFIQKGLNNFKFVNNPADATLMDNKDIDIFKEAISIFKDEGHFTKYSKDSLFLYYIEDDTFMFMDKPDGQYNSGLIVDENVYEKYQKSFSLYANDNIEGVIVIKDDKYLQMNMAEKDTFKIVWLDSAYHATVLSDEQVSSLLDIFNWDIQKREIKNLIRDGNLGPYNIEYSDEPQDIFQDYEKVLASIKKAKHRICSFELPSSIKVESEKGSLEYLRRFYLKEIFDSAKLFEIVLKNYSFINNILIVGSGAHLNLIGLSQAAKELNKNVTVSTLDTSKWGYYPKILLSNNVMFVAAYRFEFSNLIASLVDLYDMIIFTKGFNEEEQSIAPMLKAVMNNERNLIIVNSKFCNLEKQNDSVFNYFKKKFDLKRKLFNHNVVEFSKGTKINDTGLEQLRLNVCRCYKPICDVSKPVIDNEYSYHSIIYKEGFKVRDHYKK